MPISASFRVSETSTKTGSPDGNVPPTETFARAPLIEIEATVTFFATDPADGAGVLEPLPALDPVEVEVPPPEPEAVAPPVPEPASVPHESVPQSWICWTNGSLLLKRLNEMSWPELAGSGLLGSITPSSDAATEAEEPPETAPEPELGAAVPPSRLGGASGVEPGVVVAVVVAALVVTFPFGCSIFSVRGTWNASSPSRSTPPTIAIFFWR